jgi:hypothetical protein
MSKTTEDEKIIELEWIDSQDLSSPEFEVRSRAYQKLARNDCRVYGRVIRATAEELLRLENQRP